MNFKVLTLIAGLFLFFGCDSNRKKLAQEALTPPVESKSTESNIHMIVAEEVLQTKPYSYIRVSEEDKNYWIAITSREIEIGKTYYFQPEGLMLDFKSKALDRTFDSLYFVSVFSAHGMETPEEAHGAEGGERTTSDEKNNISVSPAEGGITIAELYANKASYDQKTVIIRGIVMKVNEGILNSNWIHIQDGTKSGDYFDLTITTDDLPRKDEVVTFKGKISLNKDFGAGYKYDVIMEEAVNIDRKKSI